MSQPSSPVLKARRQSYQFYSKLLYATLSVILSCCLVIWITRSFRVSPEIQHVAAYTDHPTPRHRHSDSTGHIPSDFHHSFPIQAAHLRLQDLATTYPAANYSGRSFGRPSLTTVLPITASSLHSLETNLHDILAASDALVEVVLLAPRPHHGSVRRTLRTILSESDHHEVEFSIVHWPEHVKEGIAVLQAGLRATTDWVLLTNELGLVNIHPKTRDYLLFKIGPLPFKPLGPRGMTSGHDGLSCLHSSSLPQTAAHMAPPFVLPTTLLRSSADSIPAHGPMKMISTLDSRSWTTPFGGIVLDFSDSPLDWCPLRPSRLKDERKSLDTSIAKEFRNGDPHVRSGSRAGLKSRHGSFAFIAPSSELRLLAAIVCGVIYQGHQVTVFALHESTDASTCPATYRFGECHAEAQVISVTPSQPITDEIRSVLPQVLSEMDVVASVASKSELFAPLLRSIDNLAKGSRRSTPHVQIPQEDLPYCDWMGELGINEWINWHTPKIELSVVTDNRPNSLRRLLTSMTDARYFGDTVSLRINSEQSADPETLTMLDEYIWPHGNVFLHHRVVHGGLMAAVVESWFPRGNDTYGLILEDDVELSPLFYAWAKMSLLRYRYGEDSDRSPKLFGISLYQQKALELHPAGRRPFDARSTLAGARAPHPDTPYLSQIPCSWGALYFPEHWREFHAYLIARLSAGLLHSPPPHDASAIPTAPFSPSTTVVPDVRSNRWTRSWKRYFIELVYLRGYAMLYPNFPDYASLSTNHLEAGAHVRIDADVHERKKRLFNVPLMPLPPRDSDREPSEAVRTGLLEMPKGRLPEWSTLPVLDLFGEVVDAETIVRRGVERRLELTGCAEAPSRAHDVGELLCGREATS